MNLQEVAVGHAGIDGLGGLRAVMQALKASWFSPACPAKSSILS